MTKTVKVDLEKAIHDLRWSIANCDGFEHSADVSPRRIRPYTERNEP